MIIAAATTTTSSGFNPLWIFGALQYPFSWVLQELVKIFTAIGPLKAIGAFGLSVMVLTIAIRAVLFPVFGWQLRTSRRIQAEQRLVAPQLQELRKKYKKEPQRLSQEMNALYKEHGISPFSSLTGCIPALVQMPVLIGLYQSIKHFTGGGVLARHGQGVSLDQRRDAVGATGLLLGEGSDAGERLRAPGATHPAAHRRRIHVRAVANDDAADTSGHVRPGALHAGRHAGRCRSSSR